MADNLQNKENSSLKQYINSMGTKIKSIDGKWWINICLWVLTLIALITTIVIAALQGNITSLVGSEKSYSNVIAGVVLTFSILLIISIIHIVALKYYEKKRSTKGGN